MKVSTSLLSFLKKFNFVRTERRYFSHAETIFTRSFFNFFALIFTRFQYQNILRTFLAKIFELQCLRMHISGK